MQTNLILPGQISFKQDYTRLLFDLKREPSGKRRKVYRKLCREDMYFLLRYAVGIPRYVIERNFVVERCKLADELMATAEGPNNKMIMVFREGFKSCIFNFGINLQDILRYPDLSRLILSYKKGRAVDHLNAVKLTLEQNVQLKDWFDDILYDNPNKSDKWSQDNGINVKRKASSKKEPTLSASGLVDGQPTGMHYDRLCFDDVVTKDSVKTIHMINETTEGFELADNLGSDMTEHCWKWVIGTFYKFGDTYCQLKKKGVYDVEIIPARDPNDKPYVHTEKQLIEKKKKQGRYVYSCQMMLNPVPPEDQTLDPSKLHFYTHKLNLGKMKVCAIVDPAHTEKAKRDHDPDFTAIWVVAIDRDGTRYWIDGVYDRITAPDAARELFRLQEKWNISYVSYEQVAAQADTQFIEEMKCDLGRSFRLKPCNPAGKGEKRDRILAQLPNFENGKWQFPKRKTYKTSEGKIIDLIKDVLLVEMEQFPYGHDDFLDCSTHDLPKYGTKHYQTQENEGNYDNRPWDAEPESSGIAAYM